MVRDAAIPAALTTMSSVPKRSVAAVTAAEHALASVTSHEIASALASVAAV